VRVNSDGSLTALAEGDATVTLTSPGTALTRELPVPVVTRSSDAGLELEPHLLNDALADSAGWSVTSGNASFPDQSVRLTTPSGHGTYVGETYGDELLTFDMTIEGESGWEAIEFRNQDSTRALQNTYVVVIKPNEIELHRFNNGQRTVLFGAVTGFTSVGGAAYPNDILPFGEKRQVQIGAINEEDGVRLVLNIDGRNVFYYLDTAQDRITEPGYLSVMARFWSVLLSPTEIIPQPSEAEEIPGVGALSTTSGWTSGLHDGRFEVVMDMWWGEPGDKWVLLENGSLLAEVPIDPSPAGSSQQRAVYTVSGRPNGEYVYTGVLRNSKGDTAVTPVTVRVDAAAPGSPMLQAELTGAHQITVTADLWWGTNATHYTLYDNDIVADNQPLTASSPNHQRAQSILSAVTPGSHELRVVLSNEYGESTSSPMTVVVPETG
jgi:hypothetical protein